MLQSWTRSKTARVTVGEEGGAARGGLCGMATFPSPAALFPKARRSKQSILKEFSPGISLEGMILKLKVQYFGQHM